MQRYNREELNLCVDLAKKVIGVNTLAPLPYDLPAQILMLAKQS